MDDIDRAQEREELIRSTALQNHRSLIDIEREHIKKLEDQGLVLKCRCCEEPLEGYGARWCDSECKKLDEELKAAEKRNGHC